MNITVDGVKILGVCAVVPQHVCYFEDELKKFPFPESSSRKLGRVMGFKEHRITDPKTTLCDLAAYALDYTFSKGLLRKEDLSAVIFVSQQAEHPVPGNSKVLHGKLNLPRHVHCVDMYENCTGFISALFQASCMVKSGLKNVAVVAAESGACYANILDRNTYPLCGDAGGFAIVSSSDDKDDKISFAFKHDGSRREVLITQAGGMRMPRTAETDKVQKDAMGNYRSLANLYMDGTAVFHFVVEEVPVIIDQACKEAGLSKNDIDYFITHQPNRFLLDKLTEQLDVPKEKLFSNIVENFGNSSCATIPVNIAYNLGQKIQKDSYKVCLAAFGAGLSLASAICNLGKLDFCEFIEHPGNGLDHFIDN